MVNVLIDLFIYLLKPAIRICFFHYCPGSASITVFQLCSRNINIRSLSSWCCPCLISRPWIKQLEIIISVTVLKYIFCLSQCYYIMASRCIKSVHLVMLVLEIRSAALLYMRSGVCLGNVGKSSHNLPASAAAIFSQDLPFPLESWFLSHSLSPFFLLLPVSDINFSLGIHHAERKGKHCSNILCDKKKKHFCAIMLEQNILKYISAFIYLFCVYSCPYQHMTLLPYRPLISLQKIMKGTK